MIGDMPYFKGDSLFHRLDPRVRVVAAVAFSIVLAVSREMPAPACGLVLASVAACVARLPWRITLKRFVLLNVFMALLFVTIPFSVPGSPVFALGPLGFSREGMLRAGVIAVKSNAIVLTLMVFLGTMETEQFGHALSHLHVPDKLTHLLLFTVRYVALLGREYRRLVRAMRVRAFRPKPSLHTYRILGYVVGMLLVNSFDRSERTMAAMKCRGYHGHFYLFDHFTIGRRDGVFAGGALCVLVALIGVQWL